MRTKPDLRTIREGDSTSYRCDVGGSGGGGGGGGGSAQSEATVTPGSPPASTTTPLYSYQWYRGAVKLNGERNSSLFIEKAGIEDEGEYTCEVRDFNHGLVQSSSRPSKLELICKLLTLIH